MHNKRIAMEYEGQPGAIYGGYDDDEQYEQYEDAEDVDVYEAVTCSEVVTKIELSE